MAADEARFWAKVCKTDTCWLWTGAIDLKGYGAFQVGSRKTGRRLWRAHRYSWFLSGRPLHEDLVINHLCRVRNCVNPDHMEEVTTQANVQYSASFITKCPKGHGYTVENTYVAKNRGWTMRVCRRCRADKEALRRERIANGR